MKKLLCLCLALAMIMSCGIVNIAAEEATNEIICPVTETTGTWSNSKAAPNYDGGAHIWSSDGKNGGFKIDLNAPAGKYELYFWKCVHAKSTTEMEVFFNQNGVSAVIATLDLTAGESGWTPIGVIELDGTGAYLSGIVKPNYRLGAAKLIPTDKDAMELKPAETVTPAPAEKTETEEKTETTTTTKVVVPGEKVVLDDAKINDPAMYQHVPNEHYKLVFADEFDGNSVNENVWNYRTGERLGGMNRAENVRVENGRVYNDIYFDTIDGKEMITGGGIITKDLFGYGYYETKCRLFTDTAGVHSSFWSMGRNGDGVVYPKQNLVFELDGYEIDSDVPYEITCNAVQKISEHKSFAFQPVQDFLTSQEFTFAYEWLPNEVNWYLNGELIQKKTRDDIVFHYAQQNVWLTGLANVDLSNTIELDKSKFPADVYWDYFRFYAAPMKDINVIGANEFEFNQNPDFGITINPQHPISWTESGDSDASFIEDNDHATGGHNVLAHRADKDYKVTTAQKVYYIANGNYNFEVYAMSSGGQKTAKVRLSDFNGDQVLEKDIPASDKMVKLSFENINVTNNEVLIEFISDASAGHWILVDDPNFYCTDGWEVDQARRYTMDSSDVTFGEIVAYNDEPKIEPFNVTFEGPWKKSSQPGYNGKKTQYVNEHDDEPASVTYTMQATADDAYDVCYYNVGHPKSGTGVHMSYAVNGVKVEDKAVDTSIGRCWIKLGTVDVKAGDIVTLTVDTEYGGLLRASAAALMNGSAISMREALVLRLDNNKAFPFGQFVEVDADNAEVYPKLVNDRTMVPIRFIAESLGATVGYDEATRAITINMGDSTVALQIGSDQMLVNGNAITLDSPAFEENGRTYVPVRAVSEGLGQKVTFIPDDMVIIGDKAYDATQELYNNVVSLY